MFQKIEFSPGQGTSAGTLWLNSPARPSAPAQPINWRTRIVNFKFDNCGTATDTVTITKAQYNISRSQLTVLATDSNPAAVLTVKDTSSGEILGTMQTRGDGNYRLKANGIPNPENVTVTSNLGGSDSEDVRAR